MVKLQGPMSSLSASGSLGRTMVYSNCKGVSYARKLTIPKQPKPITQVSARALSAFLSSQWSALTPTELAGWTDCTIHPSLDPYRNYLAYNLLWFSKGYPPSAEYPPRRAGGWGNITPWTVGSQNRMVANAFAITAHNHDWGVLFSRAIGAYDDTDLTHVVHIHPTPSATTYAWTESPLTAATYKYRSRPFTRRGNMRTWSADRNVVVTG